jgi:hypothetical protein
MVLTQRTAARLRKRRGTLTLAELSPHCETIRARRTEGEKHLRRLPANANVKPSSIARDIIIMKRLVVVAMLAVALCLTSLTSAAIAQVLGRYNVEGQNPSGSTYAGTATIEKTGDTYRVVWTIDGTRFVGTGIGSDEGIAISYRSGSNTGIALLGKEPWGYGLVWTYMGGTDLGTERWTRR